MLTYEQQNLSFVMKFIIKFNGKNSKKTWKHFFLDLNADQMKWICTIFSVHHVHRTTVHRTTVHRTTVHEVLTCQRKYIGDWWRGTLTGVRTTRSSRTPNMKGIRSKSRMKANTAFPPIIAHSFIFWPNAVQP